MTKHARAAEPQATEFQRFRNLASTLVQVPKNEVDAGLAKEKKARARKAQAPRKQSKK